MGTVEHVLAAMAGLGIWNAEVWTEGGEMPALDGSAAPFAVALLRASEVADYPVRRWKVTREFVHRSGRSASRLAPARALAVSCTIEFAHPAIGRQRAALRGPVPGRQFTDRFARARTFGHIAEQAALRAAGLARGASLRSTLVFDDRGVLNPAGTRFADEPVRHKVLDTLGDLCVLGGPLLGRVSLRRPGHRLLIDTLRLAVASGALTRCPPRM